MKAQLVDSIRPGDWIYEIKFDGYRALALRGVGANGNTSALCWLAFAKTESLNLLAESVPDLEKNS